MVSRTTSNGRGVGAGMPSEARGVGAGLPLAGHGRARLLVMENLRSERQQRGWTQAAPAERLGVSRQTVVALETGRYDPLLPPAFRTSRLFDKRVETLFIPSERS